MSLTKTEKHGTEIGADFLQAYLECSDEIQEVVRDLVAVLNDPHTTNEDREMTLVTLADALFPNPHEGQLGMDLEESECIGSSYSEEMRKAIAALDKEEENFATKLRQIMKEKGMTQEELADKLGIGQSAISNMLNRQCRPQRQTIERMAKALEVTPQDLWQEVDPS